VSVANNHQKASNIKGSAMLEAGWLAGRQNNAEFKIF